MGQNSDLGVSVEVSREGFTLDVGFGLEAEILVLFGPSGSGKTTILEAVAGLIQPDQGTIEFDGRTWFKRVQANQPAQDLPTRHRNLGMVFQNQALFPHLTVVENVNYGVNDWERARFWLSEVQLRDQDEQYPDQLSGGQKQRVALARALATEPEVLLLDEPFVSLDYRLSEELIELVQRVHKERDVPVLVVTHDQATALRLGNRLVVLEDGCQLGTVAHDELREEAVPDQIQQVFGPV